MDQSKSTITLTYGDCAENHVGMEQLGRRAEAGEGFTVAELSAIKTTCEARGITCTLRDLTTEAELGFPAAPAAVLVIHGAVNGLLGDPAAASTMFAEQAALDVDKRARMYGRVVNKHARWNLCFDSFDQEPSYEEGKGRVVNIESLPLTAAIHKILPDVCGPKAADLKCEGNYYYDTSKCGIGFHGDSERRKVVGLRLGAELPLHYQWFVGGKPTGKRIIVPLAGGDMYIMSEKAVGTDWKSSKIPTLRHAAGCDKFTTI